MGGPSDLFSNPTDARAGKRQTASRTQVHCPGALRSERLRRPGNFPSAGCSSLLLTGSRPGRSLRVALKLASTRESGPTCPHMRRCAIALWRNGACDGGRRTGACKRNARATTRLRVSRHAVYLSRSMRQLISDSGGGPALPRRYVQIADFSSPDGRLFFAGAAFAAVVETCSSPP